jgi:hypothetical protein
MTKLEAGTSGTLSGAPGRLSLPAATSHESGRNERS